MKRCQRCFFHLIRHGRGQIVGGGAAHRLVFEAADAVERGFLQPLQQIVEVGVGLAGEADDEGRAQRDVRADRAPCGDALQRLLLRRRALHAFEHLGRGVLERDVEIGKDLALGHQRNDIVDVRVGVDVMQPHPDAEFAERAREIDEFRRHARGRAIGSPRI